MLKACLCVPASLLASAGYLPLLSVCSSFFTEFFIFPPETLFHSDYRSYITIIIDVLEREKKSLKKFKLTSPVIYYSKKDIAIQAPISIYVYTCTDYFMLNVLNLIMLKCIYLIEALEIVLE